MAKEVKLFSLSDFLVGRYARLSDEFYDVNKRLAIKRNVVSTVFVTIGTLGYYGAYAVTIYLTVLGRFTVGAWLDDCQSKGVEAGFFSLGRQTFRADFDSGVFGSLARPYTVAVRLDGEAEAVAAGANVAHPDLGARL